MADNEKKFEARLDEQKSDVTAQVTHIWVLLVVERVRCCICSLQIFQYRAAACKLGCELRRVSGSSHFRHTVITTRVSFLSTLTSIQPLVFMIVL